MIVTLERFWGNIRCTLIYLYSFDGDWWNIIKYLLSNANQNPFMLPTLKIVFHKHPVLIKWIWPSIRVAYGLQGNVYLHFKCPCVCMLFKWCVRRRVILSITIYEHRKMVSSKVKLHVYSNYKKKSYIFHQQRIVEISVNHGMSIYMLDHEPLTDTQNCGLRMRR